MDLQCFSCFSCLWGVVSSCQMLCGFSYVFLETNSYSHRFVHASLQLGDLSDRMALWGEIEDFLQGWGRTLRGGKEANMCPWKIRQLCTFCHHLFGIRIELLYCIEMCVVNFSCAAGTEEFLEGLGAVLWRTVPLWFGLGLLGIRDASTDAECNATLKWVHPSLRWIISAKTQTLRASN